jgi:sec-independent protein translocase protein TatA
MFRLGTTELVVILIIVILLFGAGRISTVAGELGKGIREFRAGLSDEDEEEEKAEEEKEDSEEES